MIELPEWPAPNGMTASLIDFGLTLGGALGGADQRIDRAGSRYRVELTFPPMHADQARVFVSRLQRAKSEGLRVPFPLLDIEQGSPGSPVVDGGGQAGTLLAVRGVRANYRWREGYWLSIEATDGQHYLHNVAANGVADGNGGGTIAIWPPLREAFPYGAAVHLAKPMLEGLPEGDETSWQVPVNKLMALSVVIRETA